LGILSISQTKAKRSSNEALLERSAPKDDPCNLCEGDAEIFPELISQILRDGHKVRFRAPGKSMQPVILDGDCLMVEPIGPAAIKMGDIILYQAEERIIAHRVMDIGKGEISKTQPEAHITHYSFILRGDASYSYDEPVYPDQILGKIVSVERNGRIINPYSSIYKISCRARVWGSRLKRL
jgi:signal peptidase I